MRIISYNINGIRAAMKKGFLDWLEIESPDIICLQEIKAYSNQFEFQLFENLGYYCFWNSAIKKGYSGVAILSKKKPQKVIVGCGSKKFDCEGRVLRIDLDTLSVLSCYFPSGSSGDVRQNFKMDFLQYFYNFIKANNMDNLIICGDYNICHKPIDIHNPISNKNSSGFLPEERNWLSEFLDLGFIDTFRAINPEPHQYSWWSYRANSRKKNKGWRIDYNLLSANMKHKIKDAKILNNVFHSDHCPVLVEIY